MAHAAVQSQVDRIATSVLYKNHWVPMILIASGEEVEIHTSLEFVPILKSIVFGILRQHFEGNRISSSPSFCQ